MKVNAQWFFADRCVPSITHVHGLSNHDFLVQTHRRTVCTKRKQLPSNELHSLVTNVSPVALSVTFQAVHKVRIVPHWNANRSTILNDFTVETFVKFFLVICYWCKIPRKACTYTLQYVNSVITDNQSPCLRCLRWDMSLLQWEPLLSVYL